VPQLAEPADVVLVQVGEDDVVTSAISNPAAASWRVRVSPSPIWKRASLEYAWRSGPRGKYPGSVTDARSWPVSNRTSPFACSMTYTLMGSGSVRVREVSSQLVWLLVVGPTCSGRIETAPVLMTATRVIGSDAALMSCPWIQLLSDTSIYDTTCN
jgi:hypothetical protein